MFGTLRFVNGFLLFTAIHANATELCAIFAAWSCENYTAACCPTGTGCRVSGSDCVLDTGSACTLDSSQGCSGYTAECCPTSTGCEVKNSACALKGWSDCTINASLGCSDYSAICCPTTTGCEISSSGACALPSGLDAGCKLDFSKGCDGYSASCCPLSTGCAVVDNACALPPPPSECSIKLSFGCSDYSAECCPTNTGCAKLHGQCVLPGVNEKCPKEILSCSGYSAACCPISTGCVVVNNKCDLPNLKSEESVALSFDVQRDCVGNCSTPTNYSDRTQMCAYLKCLKDTAVCAPIYDRVSENPNMAQVACLCADPAIEAFFEAAQGKGDCAGAEKLTGGEDVDICQATGACYQALKQGMESLTSKPECNALMAKLESATTVAQKECGVHLLDGICAIYPSYTCENYSAPCCPTSTGCKKEGSNCVLDVASSCSLDSSKGCSGYTAECCPTSTGCEVKNNACALKGWSDCAIDPAWGCSNYSTTCCPITTGCVKTSGVCALPSGVDSSCVIDISKGCDDYSASCCPTSTGCAVVDNACTLPLPPSECSIKLSSGCSDYSAECCPTNTGCAKLNGQCVLPGVNEACPKEILSCSGYSAACCPISTGCVVVNNKCDLPSSTGSVPLTLDAQKACASECSQPTDFDNTSTLCSWLTCMKNANACAPILAVVSDMPEMAEVTCFCAVSGIADFVDAAEGNGTCASASKTSDGSVDFCQATGTCRQSLQKGMESLTSSTECSALMKKLETAAQADQLKCATDLLDGISNTTAASSGQKQPAASGSSKTAVFASPFFAFAQFVAITVSF